MCWEETFAGSLGPLVGTDCSPSSSTTGATSRTYTAASTLVHRSETVTDATGKARTLYYDVLGRLSGVMEDPTGLKYFTAYEYDLNNNLTTAKQFGECTATSDPMSNYGACTAQIVRSFAYSSLNRLTNATNPESGSIDYQYDNNGNVIRRAHGGVVRCAADSAAGGTCSGASGYDDLNRLVKQTYSDGTPTVVYGYDGVIGGMSPQCLTALSGEPPRTSAPIGRLTYVQAKNASTGANVSATSYFYTPLGHSLCQRQTTDSQDYDFRYIATPQGAMTKVTYPSGRSVAYSYDDAGRATTVMNASANTPYANSIAYAAHGPIQSLTLGNGVTESWTFNSRLQPASLSAGALTLNYSYCPPPDTSCATNNGNLLQQSIVRGASNWTQNYTYDAVNRLSAAAETGTGSWNQSYGYDARGNRWLCAHSGSLSALTPETPQNMLSCASPAGWYASGDNKIAPATWGYERGNVTSISSMSRLFTYDGENRQKTAQINGVTSTYTYDGEGRRVKAETPAGSTIFVYDAAGQLTAEYGPNTDTGTQYFTVDHLGSTRLITGSAGTVVKCYDYLPFGETIPATAGRSGTACYGATSGNRIDFTGKERDTESGLEYFGARYMSAAQGRFTSPDEPLADQKSRDPQSWNLYSYVRNRPTGAIDPDGRAMIDGGRLGSCLADSLREWRIAFSITSPTRQKMATLCKEPFMAPCKQISDSRRQIR